MKKEILTLDYLQANITDVNEAIEFVRSYYLPYPERPEKPVLKHKHTLDELAVYVVEFKEYSAALETYKSKKEAYNLRQNEVDSILESYIKDKSGLNSIVPEQYRSKVWDKAWEDGHSSGYSEVYGCLCNLVEIFE